MQSLQLIRSLVSPIADIGFFISVTSESHYDDNQIAEIINGSNYRKTQQKIADFVARCNETLSGFQQRVNETQAEYDGLVRQANAAQPGSAPGTLFVWF
jgi:uncharacterized protein YehS (DUF1456 family)